jgi:hypothetical protein
MPERFQASAAEQKSAIWQCGEAQRESDREPSWPGLLGPGSRHFQLAI